jgi:hypothetical protein
MIDRIREFLRTGGGRILAICLAVVALVIAIASVRTNLGPSEAASLSRERLYICSETGKTFSVTLEPGTPTPAPSPYSGKNTGYPAELCFWTKSGEVKKDPTGVLMNNYAGKSGPTFCPDCGRLVIAFNPPPMPGGKPPPTQAEFKPEQ